MAPSKPICNIQGTATYGQNINLTCVSEEGSPPPTYKWNSYDVLNNPRAHDPRTTDSKYLGNTEATKTQRRVNLCKTIVELIKKKRNETKLVWCLTFASSIFFLWNDHCKQTVQCECGQSGWNQLKFKCTHPERFKFAATCSDPELRTVLKTSYFS